MATLCCNSCGPLSSFSKAPLLHFQARAVPIPAALSSSTFFALRASVASSSSTFFALHASAKEDLDTSSSSSRSLDVSFFRFTLGIPGFDDSDLPRVLGIAFGAIVLLNHFLTADSITAAQWRSELVGLCNAILSINLPSIGRSLNGGTSTSAATSMSTSRQIFALAKNLSLEDKEDLAWGSYALLRNTKTTSLAIWNEELVCARGFWDIPNEAEGNILEWLEEMLRKTSLFACDTLTYLPFKADKQGWKVIPNGVVCSLVLPFKKSCSRTSTVDLKVKKGCILLLSNVQDAYTEKDIMWADLLLEKLL